MCSSVLAIVICCLVCSFDDHCAGAKETASLVQAIAMLSGAIWSGVVISNALSELDLVIVYANGRARCCANAIANVLEMDCVMAFLSDQMRFHSDVQVVYGCYYVYARGCDCVLCMRLNMSLMEAQASGKRG